MILARAPLRISLLGGGTDHPEHFLARGGAVVGLAIDRYVYCGVKRMPPGQLHTTGRLLRFRVQYSRVDDCQTIGEIRHPAVRAALRYLGLDEPLEFHVFGDLPGRSGLGASSAFAVACLAALLTHRDGQAPEGLELARETIAFEKFCIREAVGLQDQIFAAVGGVRFAMFDRESSRIVGLNSPAAWLAELEGSIVLAYSGTMRDSHEMAAQQAAGVERNTAELDTLNRFAARGAAIVESGRPIKELAELVTASWAMKRRLAPGIATPEIDALIERGMSLGAMGAKLLGAGGGGFVLFLVKPEDRPGFIEDIGKPCVCPQISHEGCRILINEPH